MAPATAAGASGTHRVTEMKGQAKQHPSASTNKSSSAGRRTHSASRTPPHPYPCGARMPCNQHLELSGDQHHSLAFGGANYCAGLPSLRCEIYRRETTLLVHTHAIFVKGLNRPSLHHTFLSHSWRAGSQTYMVSHQPLLKYVSAAASRQPSAQSVQQSSQVCINAWFDSDAGAYQSPGTDR